MKIICRNSKLSLIQAHKAKNLLENLSEGLSVEILSKPSRGDLDDTTPLYAFGDKNIFTRDIDDFLLEGKADFAVHSLKDMSSERLDDPRFFSAVFERDDPRDVIIFNKNILSAIEKADANTTIRIGTSSLRRETLVTGFLKKILAHRALQIEVMPIRGNVDTRLRKLQQGEYDAIVLAAAGLNRLLTIHKPEISALLSGTKTIFLPLVECPPAAGQGALLIECLAGNAPAVALLKQADDPELKRQLAMERETTRHLGSGCHQRFGVVCIPGTLPAAKAAVTRPDLLNIAGLAGGEDISKMIFSSEKINSLSTKKLVSTTDFMRDFFKYEYIELSAQDWQVLEKATTVFVSHHRVIQQEAIQQVLQDKKVWVSGTKTWEVLARQNIRVEGCADGFGFDFLADVFKSPLANVDPDKFCMLTNESGARHWTDCPVVATYRLVPDLTPDLIAALQKADSIFWTNEEQLVAAEQYLKKDVIHACPGGKTAELLTKRGLNPVVFPSIKAFLSWKNIL